MAKKRREFDEKDAPPNGPCGGFGIWYQKPPRHWCKLTEEDVALHLLAGHELHDSWHMNNDYTPNAYVMSHLGSVWEKGSYYAIEYNSRCRWKKKKGAPCVDKR